MEKSESIKNLAAALCKAQEEMGGASKDKENPFFKKNYADLGSVVAALKMPFADNGLSYSQFPVSNENTVGVETILMHSSGEWLSSVLLLPMVKADPQKAGSAITYARRYALQAIAGIPSEDDDGNAASQGNASSNKTSSVKASVLKMSPADYWKLTKTEQTGLWPKLDEQSRKAITATAS